MQLVSDSAYAREVGQYLSDEFPQGNEPPFLRIIPKNQQRMALAEWVDEAEREGANRNSWLNVAWHHRPRKASPADAYVTMTGHTFKQLLVVLDVVYQDAAMLEKLVKLLSEDVNEK